MSTRRIRMVAATAPPVSHLSQRAPASATTPFIKDLKLHVLVGDRVLSTALHNYRYPKPLTPEQIQQKEKDAAQLAFGRLPTT